MSYDSDDNCLVIDEDRSDTETDNLSYPNRENICVTKTEQNEIIDEVKSNNDGISINNITNPDNKILEDELEKTEKTMEYEDNNLVIENNDALETKNIENESLDIVNHTMEMLNKDDLHKDIIFKESQTSIDEEMKNKEIDVETDNIGNYVNANVIDDDNYNSGEDENKDCRIESTTNAKNIQIEKECEDEDEDMEEGEIVDDEVTPEEAKILQLREIKKKDFSIWNDIARQGNQNYNGYMNSYDMFEEYADPYDPEGLEDSFKYGAMYDEAMEDIPLGDRSRQGRTAVQRNREKGRLICKFFREGYCRDSKNCMYSHNAKDSGRTDKLCRFYQRGNCQNGLSCKNLHGEYPCYRFHIQNSCSHGDRCKYSHEPLNEYTERLLGTHNIVDDSNSAGAKKKKTLLAKDGTPLVNLPSFSDVMEQLNKDEDRTEDVDMRPFLSEDFHKGIYDVPMELKSFFNQGTGALSAQDLEAYGIATTTSKKIESPKRKPEINDYMLDLSSVDDGLTASDRILKAFQATDSEEERERAENERKEREERESRRKRKRDDYYNNRGHSNEGGKNFSRRDDRYTNRGRSYHSRSPRKDDYQGRGRNYDRNYFSPRRGQSPREYLSPRRHGSPSRYNIPRTYDSSRDYASPRRRTPSRQPSPRRYESQNRQVSPNRYHSPERRYQSSGYVSPKSYGEQKEYDTMRDYPMNRNHGMSRDSGYRESFGSPSRYNQESGFKDDRYQRDSRDIRGSRDPRREYRDIRDSREGRDIKDPRDIRDSRDVRDLRGPRDPLTRQSNSNMYGDFENRYDDPRYDNSPRERHYDNRSSPRRDFDQLPPSTENTMIRTATSFYDPTRDPRRRKLIEESTNPLKLQSEDSKNDNNFDQHESNVVIRDGPYVNPALDPRRNKKTLNVEEKDMVDKVTWGSYNSQPPRNPYDDPPMYVPGPPQSGYPL
ncbi:Zinc finger, CCCH-type domain-containing protein [Strongyloides ratti]|uniref:Zinc finger, CCCH-type domain-containing protein n=1 Tax=Strongyloides ratti TaxID=34506 RepID=A0A090KXX8_STRRB|nr:Zinc finger, CCCH-type domain-containing protein [Strongyloides ratti]CEF60088.1 Zinc finger, CCCH-type domain-containing protein [Strongyloides ratti]